MKTFRLALSLILAASLAPHARGQKPRVQKQYDKTANATEVAANVLYLLNTPEHFIQLQVRGRHWGSQPILPAGGVYFEFYSFAAEKKYRAEGDRRLSGVAGGRPLKFWWWDYGSAEGDKALQFLPRSARVSGKLVMEFLQFHVEPEQVALLAGSRDAELRLGPTRLALDDTHKSIMREFISHVTPAEGVAPESGGAVEITGEQLPPELAGATADATVKWLLNKIYKHGTSYEAERSRILHPAESSGCRISYRERTLVGRGVAWMTGPSVAPSGGMEYRVNLGDLSADSVRAVVSKEHAYLVLVTRGGEPNAVIRLNKSKELPGIVAALARAISLCQPNP
jgi:hypothetical protein